MTSTSCHLTLASSANVIERHLALSAAELTKLALNPTKLAKLAEVSTMVLDCFSSGGKLLLIGNGGSAADAQHIAAEFIGRYKSERIPLPAVALTTDTSALTAISNDYDFEIVFSRQVLGLGKKHDLLWALSTSGRSRNVIKAMETAKLCGMHVVGFTGHAPSKDFVKHADELLTVPVHDPAIVQQLHLTAAHAICDAVDQELSHGLQE